MSKLLLSVALALVVSPLALAQSAPAGSPCQPTSTCPCPPDTDSPTVISSTSYPISGAPLGSTLTVYTSPAPVGPSYGSPPPFTVLSRGKATIDHADAQAYPPLDSDFLYASAGRPVISRAQYEHWVQTQF